MRHQHGALIGTTCGIRFYEHPIYGDEAPLVVMVSGVMVETDFWEVPDAEDLASVRESIS